MLGGYDGYFDSLRWTAESTRDAPPSLPELAERMVERFDVTNKAARYRLSFLKKVGYLSGDSTLFLAGLVQQWLLDGDPTPLAVRLHHRVRFIGEMLNALNTRRTTDDLHHWANEKYRMGWEARTQIDNRRGWLQSAGLIEPDRGSLRLTDAGKRYLSLIVVEPPLGQRSGTPSTLGLRNTTERAVRHRRSDTPADAADKPERHQRELHGLKEREAPATDVSAATLSDRAIKISGEIINASTDTKNPTRFERALRDAFRHLGFDAEHLGGPGKTDVLVHARFGGDANYSVSIDAKTTSAAQLQDHQVDWHTLTEHRQQHQADYSMLVGPNPARGRLMDRARQNGVAILSAKSLADLCDLHSDRPMGLADYRSMFEQNGDVDLSKIEKQAAQTNQHMTLAKRLLDEIADAGPTLGSRTARDLRNAIYHKHQVDPPAQRPPPTPPGSTRSRCGSPTRSNRY